MKSLSIEHLKSLVAKKVTEIPCYGIVDIEQIGIYYATNSDGVEKVGVHFVLKGVVPGNVGCFTTDVDREDNENLIYLDVFHTRPIDFSPEQYKVTNEMYEIAKKHHEKIHKVCKVDEDSIKAAVKTGNAAMKFFSKKGFFPKTKDDIKDYLDKE